MAVKVITSPFTGLKAGGKYLYENTATHFTNAPRHDDKGKLLPSQRSEPVPCTVAEFPERVEGGKVVKKLVVNFANTPEDVVHDLANIPATGTFTEVPEKPVKE